MIQSKGSVSVVAGRRWLAGAFVLGLFLSGLGGCSPSKKNEQETPSDKNRTTPRLNIPGDKKETPKTDQEGTKEPKQRVASWNLKEGKERLVFEGPVPKEKPSESKSYPDKAIVAVATANGLLATASADGSVKIEADDKKLNATPSGTAPLAFDTKGTLLVYGKEHVANLCLTLSPDGKTLALGLGQDGVKVVDMETGKVAHHFKDAKESVQALLFTEGGKHLIAAAGSDLVFWDVAAGKLLNTVSMPKHRTYTPEPAVLTVAEGKLLCAPLGYAPLVAYGDANGKDIHYKTYRVENAPPSPFMAVTFSADGKYLAAAHNDNALRLWDTTTAKSVLLPMTKEKTVTPTAHAMAFSPDGHWLYVGCTDGTYEKVPTAK